MGPLGSSSPPTASWEECSLSLSCARIRLGSPTSSLQPPLRPHRTNSSTKEQGRDVKESVTAGAAVTARMRKAAGSPNLLSSCHSMANGSRCLTSAVPVFLFNWKWTKRFFFDCCFFSFCFHFLCACVCPYLFQLLPFFKSSLNIFFFCIRPPLRVLNPPANVFRPGAPSQGIE